MQSLTKVEAAKELLWLDRAQSSVLNFAGSVDIPGQPLIDEGDDKDPEYDPKCEKFKPITNGLAKHHILLLKELDKVIDYIAWKHFNDDEAGRRIEHQQHDRTMVFMPPGSAKSTYASVVTPAYAMGRLPGLKTMLASYATGIAKKQGRKGRAICRDPEFKRIFNTELSKESSAADEWALTNGSEYMAGGILSGLTGNRSHLSIIDDPVKGRKEAESEVTRKSTKEAYEDDFLTRLLPWGAVFMILTRWHESDLAGSLLPKDWDGESGQIMCRDGKVWNVICIPAECVDEKNDLLGRKLGELMWPEWFPPEHWEMFKRNKRTWSALYQQKPTPDDGNIFKKDWFKNRYHKLPADLNYYMSGDYAVTDEEDGTDPDYTIIGIWGVDPSDIIYLVDWYIGKVEIDMYVQQWINLVKLYKPFWHRAEVGKIRRAIEPSLKRAMRKAKAYTTLEWTPTAGDKVAKSRTFQALASNDEVRLPVNLKDGEIILDQLIKFPAGRHDDGVDMCSEFGTGIEEAWQARKTAPPKPEPTPNDSDNGLIIQDYIQKVRAPEW